MTDTNTDDDGSNDYNQTTREAEKAAFGDEAMGYPDDHIERRNEVLREQASAGDDEAAAKLAGWDGDGDASGGLSKAMDDADSPEWARELATAVERNTEALEALVEQNEDQPQPFLDQKI